ncbi:hypothetical protein PIB30_112561, partial [Stylosanthes scabra]|nr:hypothetical protein [Stylosanthes scabra]
MCAPHTLVAACESAIRIEESKNEPRLQNLFTLRGSELADLVKVNHPGKHDVFYSMKQLGLNGIYKYRDGEVCDNVKFKIKAIRPLYEDDDFKFVKQYIRNTGGVFAGILIESKGFDKYNGRGCYVVPKRVREKDLEPHAVLLTGYNERRRYFNFMNNHGREFG